MAVKVFIRRKVNDEHAITIKQFLGALDQWASKHEGYFYGENLENPDQPGEYLSIGTWQSIEAFHSYAHSTPAQTLEDQMASRLGMCSERAIYIRQSSSPA